VLVLLVARYMTELKRPQLELVDLLKLGGLVGVPMALVMIQPDLGTALTYLPVWARGFSWVVFDGNTQCRLSSSGIGMPFVIFLF